MYPPRRYRRVVLLLATSAVFTLSTALPAAARSTLGASFAGSAPHSSGRDVRASGVTCTTRPNVTTPPLGVVPASARQTGARRPAGEGKPSAAINPVCPPGQVPVVTPSSPGLPKGNPVRPLRAVGASALGGEARRSSAPARPLSPGCSGVSYPIEPGWCYYYAGASDARTAQGGGATLPTEDPLVVGLDHSLAEIAVQGGPNNGDVVEMGWSVAPAQFSDADPHLFVFSWANWAPTCYSCGWVQVSNAYYPGMNLSALVGQPVYNGYVYYQGNWWGWFNDQWVGYFPGSLWNGQYQNSSLVQWFGEVAGKNGIPPLTRMGDGLFAAAALAAPMSTLCDVDAAAWVCWYYDQQALYQTAQQYYTVFHAGFGAIRYGGPGQ
jgi:hypothetical protein